MVEPAHAANPTLLVLIARFEGGKLLMGHRDVGELSARDEVDSHESIGRRTALPAPGEGQFFRGIDQLIDADDGIYIAAGVMHLDPISAADAEVEDGFDFVLVGR